MYWYGDFDLVLSERGMEVRYSSKAPGGRSHPLSWLVFASSTVVVGEFCTVSVP